MSTILVKKLPVCISGSMEPEKITSVKNDERLFTLSKNTGSFQKAHLGNYFKKTNELTGIEHEFAIFNLEVIDVEGLPMASFILQAENSGEIVQIECYEHLNDGNIEMRDSNMRININLWPAFSEKLEESPQPGHDLIPYADIWEAVESMLFSEWEERFRMAFANKVPDGPYHKDLDSVCDAAESEAFSGLFLSDDMSAWKFSDESLSVERDTKIEYSLTQG